MEKQKIIMWSAAIILLVWIFSVLSDDFGKKPKTNNLYARENQIHHAVTSAKANIDCGYSEIGYEYLTPTEATSRYIRYANANAILTPEEEEMYESSGISKEPVVTYVVGKPTGSWQVSLKPDDEKKKIRIVGYGTDMNRSVHSAEVVCD